MAKSFVITMQKKKKSDAVTTKNDVDTSNGFLDMMQTTKASSTSRAKLPGLEPSKPIIGDTIDYLDILRGMKDRDAYDASVRKSYSERIAAKAATGEHVPEDYNYHSNYIGYKGEDRYNKSAGTPIVSAPIKDYTSSAEIDSRAKEIQIELAKLDSEYLRLGDEKNIKNMVGNQDYSTRYKEITDKKVALKNERNQIAGKRDGLKNQEQIKSLNSDKSMSFEYNYAKGLQSDLDIVSSVANEAKNNTGEVQNIDEMKKYLSDKYMISKEAINNYIDGGAGYGYAEHGYGNLWQLYEDLEKRLKQSESNLEKGGYDYERMTGYEKRMADAEAAQKKQAEDQQYAKDHPVISSIDTVLVSPFQGLDFIKNSVSNIGHNDVNDIENYIPMNSSNMDATNFVQTVRGQVSSDIEQNTDWTVWGQNVASFLYQTGMSVGDSALSIATFGPASIYFMGANAAASTQKQVLDNGGTNSQAAWSGVAAGVAEAFFEKFSVGNLLKQRNIKSVRALVGAVVEQSGVEATEEMLTEVANILSNAAIMGKSSDYNTAVQYYMATGNAKKRAEELAFLDLIKRVGIAGVGGFLSGFAMGGPVATSNYAANALNRKLTSQQTTPDSPAAAYTEAITRLASENVQTEAGAPQNATQSVLERAALSKTPDEKRIAFNKDLIQRSSSVFGKAGQKTIEVYDGKASPDGFFRGFVNYYNAGQNNLNLEQVKSDYADNLTVYEQKLAHMAGQADAKVSLKEETLKATNATVIKNGAGFIENEYSVKADKETTSLIHKIAEALGVTVEYAAPTGSDGANGWIMEGKVYIAQDAENPVKVVALHELTHRMQELAPEAYRKFRDYAVVQSAGPNADAISQIVRAKQSEYSRAGQELSFEQAMDEIAADYAGRLLVDEDTVKRFVKADRTTAQKFFDALKEFVAKIKSVFKGNKAAQNAAAMKQYGKTMNELETALELWGKALGEASEVAENLSDDALEFSDALVRYSIRKSAPPEKTLTGYKVFVAKDGKLYPPVVNNKIETPVGAWLDADIGEMAKDKEGNQITTKYGRPKVKSRLGALAFRPGWHLGELPIALQFYEVDKNTGDHLMHPNYVWAECEFAADKNYQGEADSMSTIPNQKSLDYMPTDGYYKFRTNPDPKTEAWYITGAMKVNRVLNDEEVRQILTENGKTPMNRVGGDIDLAKFGLDNKPLEARYSLKDSTGRDLTPEQADYFKDSKVRDEDGNLLVMYHGTPYGEFNTFRSGTYFTQSKEYADIYNDPSASSLRGKYDKASAPMTYQVYLNMERPFDTRKAKERRIFTREFHGVYSGTPLADSGLPDWTDGMDLQEFIEEKGYDYDGLILDEGATGGYGDEVKSRGFSYVLFNPEQAKRVDNIKPTSDPDIRYSLKDVERVKEFFGTTKNWNETGYILADGSQLDFSGRKDGARGGYRTVDHREIREPYTDDDKIQMTNNDAMVAFMAEGNIRISPETPGVNLSVKPTQAQESALRSFINKYRGEIIVDFDDVQGNTLESVEYTERTASDKILNDIREYFDTGKVPEISELSKFHYSLKSSDAEKRIAQLQERNAELRKQMTLTDSPSIDKAAVRTLASSIAKEYTSDYGAVDARIGKGELAQDIESLYNYLMQPAENLSYSEAKTEAMGIASGVLQNSIVRDDEQAKTFADLKSTVRDTKIYFPTSRAKDIAGYEGLGDFRKRNFGIMPKVNGVEGIPVDSFYRELSETYPGLFDENEYSHPADQLIHIIDTIKHMEPVYYNPFSHYMTEATEHLANDILERFYDTPQVKPTFADKKQGKIDEATARRKQEVQEARAQRDEKLATIRKENRERVADLLTRERERRENAVDKLKKHHKEMNSRARDGRSATELRRKIITHASELAQKLVKPSDKRHIPEDFRVAVAAMLDSINLESNYSIDPESGIAHKNINGVLTRRTETFLELRKQFKLIADGKTDFNTVLDPDLIDNLDTVISYKDTKIQDMGVSQLQTIWDTIRAIEASITNANKLFAKGKFKSIQAVAESLRAVLDNRTAKTEYKGALGWADRVLNMEMLKPVDYFRRLGSAGEALWKELRQAQDKHIRLAAQAQKDVEKILKDTDFREWGGKNAPATEFETESGDKISLTPAQVMELYLLWRRQQAQDHIVQGGIRQTVTERKGIELMKGTKAARVTVKDIAKIIGTLTTDQVRVAEALGKYMSTTVAEWGNAASMEVYGYTKFNDPNYWPIKSDRNYIKSESGKGQDVTIKGRGFTKSTVMHANNAVMIGDAFDTFAQHVNDMATYSAWLSAIEDIERVTNYRYRNDNFDVVGSVKESLGRAMGNAGTKYLDLLLEDINQGVAAKSDASTLNKLTGNYKAAAVGANLRVVVQQPTSILRAAAVIDAKYLIKGIGRKLDIELVKKYAPIAVWKDWGYFDLDTGRQMRDILLGSDSKVENLKQSLMRPAGYADSLTWSVIWNACAAEIDATTNLQKGTDSYYRAVADRFNEVIDRTQVVDGILQRNQFMRSSSDLVKMATSFMAEPTTTYSMLYGAVMDLSDATTPADKTKAGKIFAKTVVAVVVADVICAAAASLVDAMRDDDKEKDYWQKWLEAFTGITGDEDKATDYIVSLISGNIGGQINIFAKIPFVEEIFSFIQGFDATRMDMDSIKKFYDSATMVYKALNRDSKETLGNAIANLVGSAARFFGIPVTNLKRDVLGAVSTGIQASGNIAAAYYMDKYLFYIENKANFGRYYDTVYLAWQLPDKTQYNEIVRDMIANGFTQDKIDGAIKSRVKKSEEFSAASEKSQSEIVTEIKQNDVYQGLPAEYQSEAEEMVTQYVNAKTMLAQNKDYSLPDSLGWIEKAEAGASVGLTVAEFIAFSAERKKITAEHDAEVEEKKKANPDYKAKSGELQGEIVDALHDSGLSRKEKDYLFGTIYKSDKNNPFD